MPFFWFWCSEIFETSNFRFYAGLFEVQNDDYFYYKMGPINIFNTICYGINGRK